jgi:hypothetical protein
MHANHTPSTPGGFIQNNCSGGGGPCGKETHCEGYLAGEAVWDLAARDLPAMGLDPATAWQTAEKLFYLSRAGSGGDAYNCALPNADGCGTSSWFHRFRVADDDDGNLNNGTPHAAAIFAALNRHKIACGNASDPSNQNSATCPALARPDVAAAAGSNSVTLSWFPVAGAQSYRVLRNDLGCNYGQVIIDRVAAPATGYTDTDVSNNFPTFYRVQAVGASDACDSPVSECVSVSAQPFAGTVKFGQPTYGCNVALEVRVTDANVGSGSLPVTVWSASEPAPEAVTLVETSPGSGKFSGTIATTPGPAVAGDGLLSLAHGDAIDVQYIDADDGQGGLNLPRTDHATADCIFPVINGVTDTEVTDTSAAITWTTDESSDSLAVWGPVKPPANQTAGNPSTTSRRVTLGGLSPCTVYYYEVRSTDAASNVARADDGGTWYHFETLGDFGQGLQPCHQGRLTLARDVLACSDSVEARLVDMDLNRSNIVIDTAVAWASSTAEAVPERIVLTETGPNTSTFTGVVPVAQGAPVAGDGIVQIRHGDTLTVRYEDADDGAGSSRLAYDTAIDDCAGAALTGVMVTTVKDDSAVVQWSTSEPTTGAVDWGTTPALGGTLSDTGLATYHQFTLAPLAECGRVYFRVRSTDSYGNQSIADTQGKPFEFNAGMIPGVFRDGFETTTGWTLQGEWQINAPQGKGSAPGDPIAAFAGSKVLGHDLTGLGAHPGDYERGTNEQAVSPTINAAGLANPQLKFRRWLNIAPGGIARIRVRTSSGTWVEAWNSSTEYPIGVSESAWALRTISLPASASHANLAISFEQSGGPGTGATGAGWNVDRVVVKTGNTAEYDACGGCGGAPTFAGTTGARDVDACGDTGIRVSWREAPSWGTGRGGSYAIYRDTSPAINFDAAHRVAAGVAGTAWTDASAPNGQTFYYAVRAENDETCSSGPNNHGMIDANTVASGAVQDATSQPIPSAIDTLEVARLNGAHVRLSWQSTAGAATYRLYRSLAPQPGSFGPLGDAAMPSFDDLGAGANRETYFYLVRGLNLCGQEGP